MSSSPASPHDMDNLDNPDNPPHPNYNEMPTSPNHNKFLISPNPNDHPTPDPDPDPPPPQSVPSLPPEITHVFHPTINGKLSSLSLNIYYLINTGTPCNENREPLPDGTPPPHQDTDNSDEPPHQICSYTLLFSLFLRFPYIIDPPLRTSALTRQSHLLHRTDLTYLMDICMTYDSHVFTSILSISNVPPLMVQPIMSSHTTQSATFYNFALCLLSCFPFVFNLPVFTFHPEDHHQRRATQLPIPVSPRIEI